MDSKEIFDAFKASGSAEIRFSATMFEDEEIKQENFDGWDAAARFINYLEFLLFVNIYFIHMASL